MEVIYSVGTMVLGAALSLFMMAISRSRYAVPSARKTSWCQTTGGRDV